MQSIDSMELTEWMAYEQVEPFGQHIDNWRAAQICAVIANVNRNTEKRPEPYRVADFIPSFEAEDEDVPAGQEQQIGKSPEQLMAQARFITNAYAATHKKK